MIGVYQAIAQFFYTLSAKIQLTFGSANSYRKIQSDTRFVTKSYYCFVVQRSGTPLSRQADLDHLILAANAA